MNRFTVIILLALICISCKKENTLENIKPTSKNNLPEKIVSKPKKISDYASDNKYFMWYAKQSDTASYWVRVSFQKEFATYQFHGQCIYSYFTNQIKKDKIELLWTYKTDCLLDMEFLEKSNGIKKYPKAGDAFCEYQLMNDSVIKVSYNFPEWTKRVNEIEKDSIFPQYLYLEKS